MPGALFLCALDERVGDVQIGAFIAYGLGAAVQFDQANGFSRNPEADRHFRAKRPKCEVLPEGVEQVATLLVAAIEAHLLANQAAAYTDQDLLV